VTIMHETTVHHVPRCDPKRSPTEHWCGQPGSKSEDRQHQKYHTEHPTEQGDEPLRLLRRKQDKESKCSRNERVQNAADNEHRIHDFPSRAGRFHTRLDGSIVNFPSAITQRTQRCRQTRPFANLVIFISARDKPASRLRPQS
jgi:hypothetical protein